MSFKEHPSHLALEVDADLLECALKMFMSTPEFSSTAFTQPEIVDLATSLWGWIVLNNN